MATSGDPLTATSGYFRMATDAYLDRVRASHPTKSYKKAMRKRAVWIEPLFGVAKQWHGLRQFRLHSLAKVNSESLLTAAGQNLKRWLATGWGRRHAPRGALTLPTGYPSNGLRQRPCWPAPCPRRGPFGLVSSTHPLGAAFVTGLASGLLTTPARPATVQVVENAAARRGKQGHGGSGGRLPPQPDDVRRAPPAGEAADLQAHHRPVGEPPGAPVLPDDARPHGAPHVGVEARPGAHPHLAVGLVGDAQLGGRARARWPGRCRRTWPRAAWAGRRGCGVARSGANQKWRLLRSRMSRATGVPARASVKPEAS